MNKKRYRRKKPSRKQIIIRTVSVLALLTALSVGGFAAYQHLNQISDGTPRIPAAAPANNASDDAASGEQADRQQDDDDTITFEEITDADREALIIQDSGLDESMLAAVTDGGRLVGQTVANRPEEIALTADNARDFAKIVSCSIQDNGVIELEMQADNIAASDDKNYYLMDMPIYADTISADAQPIATAIKGTDLFWTAEVRKGKADSRLFRQFVIAIKQDGAYLPITKGAMVTNPEAVASGRYSGMQHDSIKGILPDPSRLGDLKDLGVNYVTYNIPLARILGGTSNGAYPTISWSYGGQTYNLNGAIVHEYDVLFTYFNSIGVDVAAIVLNNASTSAYPEVTHPKARSGSTAPYRMFNGSDEAGVKSISAIAAFLTARYTNAGHGNVSMWIFGNEVNARKEWNYMEKVSLSEYTRAYADSFRVFYNTIKSINGGAKVYACFDQQWNRDWSANPDYDTRDMLDLFASSIRAQGDINWGLAFHPYSYPNGNTAFWKSHKLVSNSVNTSIITMGNINVLTDYMGRKELLNPDGEYRSIIFSEFGYSSSSGQDLQAAAFAYAYKLIEQNGHVDAIMFSRQTDASEEIAAFGLALGLETTGGGHKKIYDVFKYIDTERSDEVTAFAKSIVGKDF